MENNQRKKDQTNKLEKTKKKPTKKKTDARTVLAFLEQQQAWLQETPAKIPKTQESSNLTCSQNFVPKLKNLIARMFEITESICCLYECLPIRKKFRIMTQFSFDTSLIYYWGYFRHGVPAHTHTQSTFTCSWLTTETLEQDVKYVQS